MKQHGYIGKAMRAVIFYSVNFVRRSHVDSYGPLPALSHHSSRWAITSRFEWRLMPTSAWCSLSATMESLLIEFVATQQSAQRKRQLMCVAPI
jgi:hypothetical protein